ERRSGRRSLGRERPRPTGALFFFDRDLVQVLKSRPDPRHQLLEPRLAGQLGEDAVLPEEELRQVAAGIAIQQVGLEDVRLGTADLARQGVGQVGPGLVAGELSHDGFSTLSRRRTHSSRSTRTRWSSWRIATPVIPMRSARSDNLIPSK